MSDRAVLPNGAEKETWLSDIEDKIGKLEADLEGAVEDADDRFARRAIEAELIGRRDQLRRRREYLAASNAAEGEDTHHD